MENEMEVLKNMTESKVGTESFIPEKESAMDLWYNWENVSETVI